MQGERVQILKMLEEGKITSDEAVKLLDSIEDGDGSRTGAANARRMLRIRVTEGGQPKVNVNLPVSLATVALKIASRFDQRLGDIDVDELVEEIRRGVEGPLVEVEHDNDKIVVLVE